MKKFTLGVLAVSLIFVSACTEVTKSQPAKSIKLVTSTNSKAIAKCEAEAQKFIKEADHASSKDRLDLAKAYNDCAAAQKEIAEGYRAGNNNMVKEGQNAFKQSMHNLNKLKQQSKTREMGCQDQTNKSQGMYDSYLKKVNDAQKNGKQDLAALYQNCANACKDMVDGMKECMKNHARCKQIYHANPELASPNSQKMHCDSYKSGMKCSPEKMEKCIQGFRTKADQMDKEGNAKLAKVYRDLADAKKVQCESCMKVQKAKQDLAAAQKKIKKELQKKATAAKTEKKAA